MNISTRSNTSSIIDVGANGVRPQYRTRGMFRAVLSSLSVFVFAGGVFSGGTDNWILVPFVVNVDATVTASQSGVVAETIDVAAGEVEILSIYLGPTLVRHGGAVRQSSSPLVSADARGNINLRLPEQSYRSAEVSVHSVNGRRVLQRKVDASSSVNGLGISRSNAAPGVYLISVKGKDGNNYSTRLTHRGGAMNVNVSFGAASPALGKEAVSAKANSDVYEIRVSAAGYKDSTYSLALVSGVNPLQNITLVPSGGGDEYEFVLMPDGKHWMKKNLNIETENSWCYNNSPDSCAKYGRLYTWEAALSVCPTGWHLPSEAEWTALTDAVGGLSTAGTKLKSATGWTDQGLYAPVGTDYYGFSALPGGRGYSNGTFYNAGYYGNWWSASEYSAGSARGRNMVYDLESVRWGNYDKSYRFSVRCVRGD